MAKSMYDIIKKQNGETFAKAIRNYDNGIFDIPDLDKIVKYAGRRAEPIMMYLISLKGVQIEEQGVHQDPIALLKKAGYDAYVADTLKKQNAIKKYYASGEELCTFNDPNRFKNYYIINAVHKDADKIKRSKEPMREDAYGTSVLSIQVLKTGGFISIKNRYNHTVQNPDNTLNSNPDNIIPGLSDAIKHHFSVDFSAQRVALPNGWTIINGQIVKYACERNNVYCGEGFYAKDGKIFEINKQTEMMIGDGLLFSLKDKTITDITRGDYDVFTMEPSPRDRFIAMLNRVVSNKKIQIVKNPLGGHDILADGAQILTVDDGDLVNINIPDADIIALTYMSNLRGELDFSGVKELHLEHVDLSHATDIKFNPNADSIKLRSVAHIPMGTEPVVDFSGVNDLSLEVVNSSCLKHIKFNPNAHRIYVASVSGWIIGGDLDLGNVLDTTISNIAASNITNVRLNPNANSIYLRYITNLKIRGAVDVSGVKKLGLEDIDASGVTDIKLNPNADTIALQGTGVSLRGVVDCSNVSSLSLRHVDASGVTDIKFPGKSNRIIQVDSIKGLKLNTLDLRGLERVAIYNTDLSKVSQILFNEYAQNIILQNVGALHGGLDFGKCRSLQIGNADVSHADMSFNPLANIILLDKVKGLRGDLDFSGVSSMSIVYTDLSKATPHFNSFGTTVDVRGSQGLRGDLDFSNLRRLCVGETDLSGVTSIKLPPSTDGYIDTDRNTILLRVGKSKLQYKIAQFQQKLKSKFTNPGQDK